MQTATMERPRTNKEVLTETVTVKYVNEPKAQGKPGSIKDAGGQYYSVWNMALLAQFRAAVEAGNDTCFVDYTINDNGFRTATAMRPVASRPAPKPQQQPTPQTNGKKMDYQNTFRPVDERTAKRMFLCATFAAYVHAGRVERNREAMAETLDMLSAVYDEKIGGGDPDNPLAAG